jgi:hypothetical protein
MDADVKTFVGFVAPLAIVYLTWASITTEIATSRAPAFKSVNVGQLTGAPKLPSAERELRDPFTPEGTVSAALASPGGKSGTPNEDLPLHLDGTVLAGKLRFAIISGTRVMEGDYIRGLRLVKVETNRVVLSGGKGDTVLPLEIVKSESIQPTTVAAAETPHPAEATAPASGMGSTTSRGTAKSSATKKPGAGGGMGSQSAPKPGGMGH